MTNTNRMGISLVIIVPGLLICACSGRPPPATPSPVATTDAPSHASETAAIVGPHASHASSEGQSADKGYLDGWFEGSDVHLYYTKSFFCAEPPASGAPTNCEIGAGGEVDPRPGPIPVLVRTNRQTPVQK